MLVNKCDNCKREFVEGESPEWIQLTGDRGVMMVMPNHQIINFPVLDFCCPDCVATFVSSTIDRLVTPPTPEPTNDPGIEP